MKIQVSQNCRKIARLLVISIALLSSSFSLLEGTAAAQRLNFDWTVLKVHVPGAKTVGALSVTNAAEVLGTYSTPSVPLNYFQYSITTAVVSPFTVPAACTGAAINSSEDLVGSCGTQAFIQSGGVLTEFSFPGATNTVATAINDIGQVVGYYTDPTQKGITKGFLYDNGTLTSIVVAGAFQGTVASSINNLGQVVGTYSGTIGYHSFLWENGVFSTITAPAGCKAWSGVGVNDLGSIVGVCFAFNGLKSYLQRDHTVSTIQILSPFGQDFTVLGVNNSDQVVGQQFLSPQGSAILGVPNPPL